MSLGIQHDHLNGRRRWTEEDLRQAVRGAGTWSEVAASLAIETDPDLAEAKGYAARLQLGTEHLEVPHSQVTAREVRPDIAHLSRAGSLMAAAWFSLCGHEVSWPLEPCRYDLLVHREAGIRRVQVKTTTARAGDTWKVYLSTSGRARRTYDPDEIDDFFVIDGDLAYYLIPVGAVGGLHAIHLGPYDQYRLRGLDASHPG